jgi:hypothetical protein
MNGDWLGTEVTATMVLVGVYFTVSTPVHFEKVRVPVVVPVTVVEASITVSTGVEKAVTNAVGVTVKVSSTVKVTGRLHLKIAKVTMLVVDVPAIVATESTIRGVNKASSMLVVSIIAGDVTVTVGPLLK